MTVSVAPIDVEVMDWRDSFPVSKPLPAVVDGVQLPASINDAVRDLNGLGALITASEWKRAAIVWAFTRDGRKSTSGVLTVAEFVALGLEGMRSQTSVAKYRKAWKLAIDHGYATDVKPGDWIDLPDVEWQLYFNPPDPGPFDDPDPQPDRSS